MREIVEGKEDRQSSAITVRKKVTCRGSVGLHLFVPTMVYVSTAQRNADQEVVAIAHKEIAGRETDQGQGQNPGLSQEILGIRKIIRKIFTSKRSFP